jgi:hypothetical protein
VIKVYQTEQGKNRAVCRAFAAGCGAQIVGPYPLQPEGDVFMFGALRGLLPTLHRAQQVGRTWFYGDNGYFLPERVAGRCSGYFRVTRNAFQHSGSGNAGPDRWNRLRLQIKPWRRFGDHIVVCPPARLLAAILDFDADRWLKDALATLTAHTDRPIRVRQKMSWAEVMSGDGPPLSHDLKGAWALVTHTSNAAVEALLAGVPVFCTAPCAAHGMGWRDLSWIERPVTHEGREQWAWNLASAQWTLAEMADGTCWRDLNA